MTILEKNKVRAAVERALQLDEKRDREAAIASVALALCLPVEAVSEAIEQTDEVSQ